MAKIKTFYHEEFIKNAQRSLNYQFTLPVDNGQIQDRALLDTLRQRVATLNTEPTHRYVIDLKWRGPRHGDPYNTSREHAYAVDVYLRRRREW